MNKRRAVLFAAHPWHVTPYGLHHVARALAKLDWRVLYVEPQFTPVHLIAGFRRGRQVGACPRPSGEPGIELLSPFAPLPHVNRPLLRNRWVLELISRWNWPPVARTVLRDGTPDLALVGSPTYLDAARATRSRVLAYRLADDASLFSVVSRAVREVEARGLSQVDAVLATTPLLARKAEAAGARSVVMMPNGVDIARFAKPLPVPTEMANLPRPIILYVGAIEDWFDWGAVVSAARASPQRSFVIVGHVAREPNEPLPANVHLLGPRPYDAVPAYMRAADIGIVPFALPRREEAIEAINPLKIHEYLAAGLPVVSSVVPAGCEEPRVFGYRGARAFCATLDRAVAERERGTAIVACAASDWQAIVSGTITRLGLS